MKLANYHTNLKTVTNGLLVIVLLCGLSNCVEKNTMTSGPYFATGIKIGEVTTNSAIIWSRLTKNEKRVQSAPIPNVLYQTDSGTWITRPNGRRPDLPPKVTYPEGYDVTNIEGAVPGMKGWIQLKYRKKSDENWKSNDWVEVEKSTDFTENIKLKGLESDTHYEIQLLSSADGKTPQQRISGSFTTAQSPDVKKPLTFTVTTCSSYDDIDSAGYGHKVYDEMEKVDPAFFLHLGDILYYDDLGKTAELARWHWDRMYSLPAHINFHKRVPSYFLKDDHDTWMDDSWPGRETRFMGDFTFEEGLKFFTEEVPIDSPTYRTIRWGKDLQIWMVEGRDYRTPNPVPDGPEKTIWGQEQKDWFYETVAASDATFKILFSPTPIVGPDRSGKNDNHANEGFAHEGAEIRNFISNQENMYVVCGDRHWQYVSVDPTSQVKEFSVGPTSNAHAQGWKQDDRRPQHEYLNVTGGFFSGELFYEGNTPQLKMRHHGVDGSILNEKLLTSAQPDGQ